SRRRRSSGMGANRSRSDAALFNAPFWGPDHLPAARPRAIPAPVHAGGRESADPVQPRGAGAPAGSRESLGPGRSITQRVTRRIDQVLGSSAPYDAVTTQALAYRELFARDGAVGGISAAAIALAGLTRITGVELLA